MRTAASILIWIALLVTAINSVGSAQAVRIDLVTALSGFTQPVYLTNADDGTGRRFIVEQPGRILVAQRAASVSTVFLDIQSRVLSGGEQGLLGLAFHPQYATNGRFFVNYTRRPDGATVIAEYHVSSTDPNQGDPNTEVVFLVIAQPYANHNGGMIEFGQDGYLYIGMGDGGSGNDPENYAQNIEALLGKMLRIDIDHPESMTVLYSSPTTNPFYGPTPGRDEIYALGFRNPWRFSFDRSNGVLYLGDVGQDAIEEIDVVSLGQNHGWRVWEGNQCTGLDPCATAGFTFPIAQYTQSSGRCAITGGYVYRGSDGSLPAGAYVYGDFCTGEIFMLSDGEQTLLLNTPHNISSFGEDESGEIYVVTYGGTIFRIRRKFSAQVTSI
jgi:glucose/arabinose dehydrogenase